MGEVEVLRGVDNCRGGGPTLYSIIGAPYNYSNITPRSYTRDKEYCRLLEEPNSVRRTHDRQ